MLLNVWEQWQDSGFSISWTYEHFIQIKVLLVSFWEFVGFQLINVVSLYAVSDSGTEHSRSARAALRACRDLCRRKPQFE